MANTDITLTQLKTELGAVKTAIRAQSWDTAYQECVCAQATLAGLAETQSDGGTMVRYRTTIAELMKLIERGQAAQAQSSSRSRFAFAKTCSSGVQRA